MGKRIFFFSLFLFLVTGVANKANAIDGKVKYVVDKENETIEIMKQYEGDKAIQPVVNKYFNEINFEWSARMAIGRYWKELSEREQKEYLIGYIKLFCYTWLDKFSYKNGGSIKIKYKEETEKVNDKDDNVYTTLLLPNNSTVDVMIRVRGNNPSEYKMLNLAVEGVDLTMSTRAQFMEYIEKHGSPQALLKFLKEKNIELAKTAKFVIPNLKNYEK